MPPYLLEVGREPVESDALGDGVVAVATDPPLLLLRRETHPVLHLTHTHMHIET